MPETKQYGIIYADPPWHYDRKHGSGVAENHYPTMSMDCCQIDVTGLWLSIKWFIQVLDTLL